MAWVVVAVALAGLGLAWSLRDESPEAERPGVDAALSGPSQQDIAGGAAWVVPPAASAVAVASPSRPALEAGSLAKAYGGRLKPVSVLAHEALVSNSPEALDYAMTYVLRCGTHLPPTDERLDALRRGWDAFCRPLNPKALDHNLLAALSAAGERAGLASTSSRLSMAEVAAAAQSGDAELVIERFFRVPAAEKARWLNEAGFDAADMGLTEQQFQLLADTAIQREACRLWGCDEGFRLLFVCAHMQLCSQDSVTAQLDALLALIPPPQGGRAAHQATWERARERAREATHRGLRDLMSPGSKF